MPTELLDISEPSTEIVLDISVPSPSISMGTEIVLDLPVPSITMGTEIELNIPVPPPSTTADADQLEVERLQRLDATRLERAMALAVPGATPRPASSKAQAGSRPASKKSPATSGKLSGDEPAIAPPMPLSAKYSTGFTVLGPVQVLGPAKGQRYVNAAEREAEDGGQLNYGLDRDLAAKRWAKYDPVLEASVRAWVEAVLGEPLEGATLQEALRSGIALCRLANAIEPGCCAKPSTLVSPFKQMENIGNYLEACTTPLGQPVHATFQTIDLYEEGKDFGQVLMQVHSLARIAEQRGYKGATFGAKKERGSMNPFSKKKAKLGEGHTPKKGFFF